MRIEKRIAVLDTSVVVAGIFWKSDAYRCLAALARRRFFAVASPSLMAEYRRVAARLQAEQESDQNPGPILDWLENTARLVEPWPLADSVSRDADDDVLIATALAAKASFVVTHDPDLLVLEKPFGIEKISRGCGRFNSEHGSADYLARHCPLVSSHWPLGGKAPAAAETQPVAA